jgi:hypothetical protein
MSALQDPSFFGIYEDLILNRNGVWLSNGEEVTHERTCQAFAKNLFRCKDGFEIRLGPEKKSIHVEDTIYFVTSMLGDPDLGFELTLNDGRKVELKSETLHYRSGRLTCKVYHPNEQTHEEAKFLTTAYYELLKYIEKNDEGFLIVIEGKTILLGQED